MVVITSLKAKINHLLQRSLKLWFLVRYRQRHARLCLERVNGLTLVIPPEVFNPALFGSSFFLAKYLRRHPPQAGSLALDLGCGSGLLGLELARAGARVIATDINPQAAWVAGVNAHLNGLSECHETRQGSLYEPVAGEKFDLIVMNPPYYAHHPKNPLEQAFMAGPQLETLTGMIVGIAGHLETGGQALAVVSSTIPLAPSLEAATKAGLKWQVVARQRYWAEWHLIYEFKLDRQ